jgi:hypothetical protein
MGLLAHYDGGGQRRAQQASVLASTAAVGLKDLYLYGEGGQWFSIVVVCGWVLPPVLL